jgi:membrane-bound ClpP family serine protease
MRRMVWAFLLILLGLLLLVLELFVPSGGAITTLAIVALVVGVVMVFYAPESEGGGTTAGFLTIGGLLVVIPLFFGVAFHYWPRTPIGKKFFLPEPDADATLAASLEFSELEQLKGQIGKTITPHGTSGSTLIQGRRIDTKTEGLFVEAGTWVRVVDVRAGQVTVRPLSDDEVHRLPDDLNA